MAKGWSLSGWLKGLAELGGTCVSSVYTHFGLCTMFVTEYTKNDGRIGFNSVSSKTKRGRCGDGNFNDERY